MENNEINDFLSKHNKETLRKFNELLDKFNYTAEMLGVDLADRVINDIENGDIRQAKFKLVSKKAMNRYMNKGRWSNLELAIKEVLDSMGLEEGVNYWHNFKLHNRRQTAYFEVDFIIPGKSVVIECDGTVWHGKMGDSYLKDKRRDRWLNELGYKVIRISGKSIKLKDGKLVNKEELIKRLKKEIDGRCSGLHIQATAINLDTLDRYYARFVVGSKKGKISRFVARGGLTVICDELLSKLVENKEVV